MLKASRTINAVIIRSLAAVDAAISVPQLRVMVILSHSEHASLAEVATDLAIDSSSASRTCDQLVKRDLVEREPADRDRRRLSLRLSPAGRRLLQRVMSRRAELLAEIVAAMSEPDQRALMAAMDAFNTAADGARPPPRLGTTATRSPPGSASACPLASPLRPLALDGTRAPAYIA